MSSSRKSATVCNNSGNAMSPLARPGVRSSVAIVDMCLIGFMGSSNLALNLTPCMNSSQPERGLLKSANIEQLSCSYMFYLRLSLPHELARQYSVQRLSVADQ